MSRGNDLLDRDRFTRWPHVSRQSSWALLAPRSSSLSLSDSMIGLWEGSGSGRSLLSSPSASQRERLHAAAKTERNDMHSEPTVLFLCVHNAGRSQMAAGWAPTPGRGSGGCALSRVQSCRGDQSHRRSGDGRGRDRHKRAVSQAMDLGNVGSRQRGGHDGLWRRLSGDTGKALPRVRARRSGREIARRCTPYQGRDPGPRPARQNPPQSSETTMVAFPHRMCSVILVGGVKGPYPFVTLPRMLTR